MSAEAGFLAVHIAAGSLGLVLGPVLFAARKARGLHTIGGELYHWTFLVLFLSAVGLAVLNWEEVWWLALVGAFSYSFALRGYLAAKRRGPGWIAAHISGQGGSYISMTTALLVVNWEDLTGQSGLASMLPWFLPTIVGAPLIALTVREVMLGRRPKAWASRPVRPTRSGSSSAA
ncbi:MAG TPA: hypothetical protein VHF58_07630 [Solirubrobacterales bacterium]|nr:hypothetical protein [Solirubrobacterales bacterium]